MAGNFSGACIYTALSHQWWWCMMYNVADVHVLQCIYYVPSKESLVYLFGSCILAINSSSMSFAATHHKSCT